MLEVRWDKMAEGHFNQWEESLRRALGQYIRRYKPVYVGMTVNPERRAKEHDRRGLSEEHGWSSLIVIWRTTSYRDAQKAERILVDWAGEDSVNLIRGGAGLKRDAKQHFIYVVV